MPNDDLISRKSALRLATVLSELNEDGWKLMVSAVKVDDLQNIPAVDAEPVRLSVEKVDVVESNGWYRKRFYCPCGQLIRTEAWGEKRCFGQGTILKENVMPHYCPNCGAKMDLEEDTPCTP